MSNPITRLFQRAAFVIGGYKYQVKKSLQLFPKYLAENANWIITGNESYISEGFLLNAIIYGAIMYKVRAAQAALMTAFTGSLQQKEPLPAAHPLARLLERPNHWQSFIELDSESRVFFNLFGNAYIYFKRRRGTEYPESFFNLPPYRVRHIYGDDGIKGYAYIPPGATIHDAQPIDPRDMMHVRNPNPADQFLGQGKGAPALAAGGRSADVDNVLTSYLKQFVDYGAMPPGILSVAEEVSEEDAAAYRDRFMDIYGGAHRWTDVAVLGGSAEYQAIGSKLNELASNILDARNENRIVMVFGVPLPLIQTNPQIVQSTFSNLQTYEEFFWNNTMIPELRLFGTEYRYFLRGEDGSFPAYDVSTVPILRKIQDEHGKIILDGAKSGFFTRAQVKASLGEPFDPLTDNVYMLPFNVQMVAASPRQREDDTGGAEAIADDEQREEETPRQEEQQQEPNEKAERKASHLNSEQRELFWKAFVRTAEVFEPKTEDAASAAFREDEREILAIVNKAKSAAYSEAKSVNWTAEFTSVSDYLSGDSKGKWRAKFDPVFTAITVAQGERLESTFGIAFDVRSVLTNEFLEQYKFTFADPISDVSIDEIRAMFEQAAFEGWSIDQMESNLGLLFKQWIEGGVGEELTEEQRERTYFAENRLPPHRVRSIGRTETIRASNAASLAVYDDWGVPQKEWLSTPNTRTRDSHRVGSAWGGEPLVAAIGEPFILPTSGAALMFPGDPSAPLDETIQCRCTHLPVFGGM